MIPARDILAQVYGQNRSSAEDDPPLLRAYWAVAAGPALARVTRPVCFIERRLIVEADSAAWRAEVEPLLGTLRRRLNEAVGRELVRKIQMRTRPSKRPPQRAATSAPGEADGVVDPVRRRLYLSSRRSAEGASR